MQMRSVNTTPIYKTEKVLLFFYRFIENRERKFGRTIFTL